MTRAMVDDGWSYRGQVQAVIFDWAGTMVDHGCVAPARVFVEAFARRGVEVTEAEARAPMGMAKREHFLAMIRMPGVRTKWTEVHGAPPGEADVDAMYESFLPLLVEEVAAHSSLIEGAKGAADALRERGVRIGSSTGYPANVMEVVAPLAAKVGYAPEAMLTASDFAAGRPAPWMIFENMKRLDVRPTAAVVKVDDSPHGIEAGRNAGVWTIGVAATGNAVGLDADGLAALPDGERRRRIDLARDALGAAHYVVERSAEVPGIVARVEARLARGERP